MLKHVMPKSECLLFVQVLDTNLNTYDPNWLSTGDIFKRKALLLLWFPWWLSRGGLPSPCCRPRSPRTHFLPGLLSLSAFNVHFHFSLNIKWHIESESEGRRKWKEAFTFNNNFYFQWLQRRKLVITLKSLSLSMITFTFNDNLKFTFNEYFHVKWTLLRITFTFNVSFHFQ